MKLIYYHHSVGNNIIYARVSELHFPKNKYERDNNPIIWSTDITNEEASLPLDKLASKYPIPKSVTHTSMAPVVTLLPHSADHQHPAPSHKDQSSQDE